MPSHDSRFDRAFSRWDRWADKHSRSLGATATLLTVLTFIVIYLRTGSLLMASVSVAAVPLLLVMATAVFAFVTVPSAALMDHLAERLAARGWRYWLAFICLIPLGLAVMLLMMMLLNRALSSQLP